MATKANGRVSPDLQIVYSFNSTKLIQNNLILDTTKHLIFVALKFSNFKRLSYWHCLILAVSYFKDLLKSFSFTIGSRLLYFKSSPFYGGFNTMGKDIFFLIQSTTYHERVFIY